MWVWLWISAKLNPLRKKCKRWALESQAFHLSLFIFFFLKKEKRKNVSPFCSVWQIAKAEEDKHLEKWLRDKGKLRVSFFEITFKSRLLFFGSFSSWIIVKELGLGRKWLQQLISFYYPFYRKISCLSHRRSVLKGIVFSGLLDVRDLWVWSQYL